MLFDDPEAPTTIDRRFDYGPLTGGRVTGSVTDRRGLDRLPRPAPVAPHTAPTAASTPGRHDADAGASVDAAAAPVPRKQASNFLVVAPQRSATGNTLAVMGPQLGYYYPEIVQQIHLSGPGIEAQGVAVPGMAMYILIGRTHDYAWSLTSANHDVRDVFAEQLCNPDGSRRRRAQSDHYLFKGECRPFDDVRRGHAQRHADPLPDVGARSGDRDRDRRRASRTR